LDSLRFALFPSQNLGSRTAHLRRVSGKAGERFTFEGDRSNSEGDRGKNERVGAA